jgi:hypothetical protein
MGHGNHMPMACRTALPTVAAVLFAQSGRVPLTGDFDTFFFLSGDAVVVDFFSGDDTDTTSFLSSAPCSIELQ